MGNMEQRHIKQIESAFALMSVEQRAAKIAELSRRNAPAEIIEKARQIDRQLSAKNIQAEPASVRVISPEERAVFAWKVRTISAGVLIVGSGGAIVGLFVIPTLVANPWIAAFPVCAWVLSALFSGSGKSEARQPEGGARIVNNFYFDQSQTPNRPL